MPISSQHNHDTNNTVANTATNSNSRFKDSSSIRGKSSADENSYHVTKVAIENRILIAFLLFISCLLLLTCFNSYPSKHQQDAIRIVSFITMTYILVWLTFFIIGQDKILKSKSSAGLCFPRFPLFEQPYYDHLQPSNISLREYLASNGDDDEDGYYIAMGPSFFGFFAYFGALAALDDAGLLSKDKVKGVAGASAGAMAATLIARGKKPSDAANFACSVKLSDFADPPGYFGAFKGNNFEYLMQQFLSSGDSREIDGIPLLENSEIPVALTTFDLLRMRTKVLTEGNAARASRASSTFPGLFQPVIWKDQYDNSTSVLIDGGVLDHKGLLGLSALKHRTGKKKRVLNILLWGNSQKEQNLFNFVEDTTSLVTLKVANLPRSGPFSMSKGPMIVELAKKAMTVALDQPLMVAPDGQMSVFVDSIVACAS